MVAFLYFLAIILAFMVGTVGFSLVNTVEYRFVRQKRILHEHFTCDFCGTQIKPYEAVPVFSYIFLKGRCRYCGESLSKRDFVNELMGGLLGLLIFFRFGDEASLSSSFVLSSPIDIVVHFDNDRAGRDATKAFIIALNNRYDIYDIDRKSVV